MREKYTKNISKKQKIKFEKKNCKFIKNKKREKKEQKRTIIEINHKYSARITPYDERKIRFFLMKPQN